MRTGPSPSFGIHTHAIAHTPLKAVIAGPSLLWLTSKFPPGQGQDMATANLPQTTSRVNRVPGPITEALMGHPQDSPWDLGGEQAGPTLP